MRRSFLSGVLVLVTAGAVTAAAVSAAPGAYALIANKVLGGDGGWDYLTYDAAGKRLFISRATRVMVVNPADGTMTAELPNTPGVHGIALSPDHAYTSNGRDNSVSVFDLATLAPVDKIAIPGKNPDAIVYEPVSRHIVTFDGGSNDASFVDARTNTNAGVIVLPGRPEFAVADGRGKIFDNIEDKNEIVEIDGAKEKVVAIWPITPCDGPSGLAIDAKNRRLFSVCHNKIMTVTDADSGHVIATLPIGDGPDAAGFDPKTQNAYSSNGEGTLTVVHEDSPNSYHVVQTVNTQPYARTLAVNPDANAVYLVTAQIKQGTPPPHETRPSRSVVPGTFSLLTVGPEK